MEREDAARARARLIESRLLAGEAVYPYDFKENMSIEHILRLVEKHNVTKETIESNEMMKEMRVSTGGG